MGSLTINKVRYDGDLYQFESPEMDSDIVIIEGDNGTGKTTFFKLIYHAFGGSVDEFKS